MLFSRCLALAVSLHVFVIFVAAFFLAIFGFFDQISDRPTENCLS